MLLKLLDLEHRPVSGRVLLFGNDSAQLDARRLTRMRRRIGVVSQDFRLLDHLSLRDNAALPLRVAGKNVAAHARDIDELIRWVGLSRRSAARPPELSAGEKQRIAIARAVVNAPGLVLANAEHLFLLEPRLGAGNLLDDLPAPRLIEVRIAGPGPEAPRLQARLDAAAPGAVYDDHALWRGPLVRAATALRQLAWLATARHSVRLLLRQMC